MKIEVAAIDRNRITGRVKLGIGTENQFGALYSAGAQEVRTHDWVKLMFKDDPDLLLVAFRPEDTIIMVQPNLLSFDEIKRITSMTQGFYVPECGSFKLGSDKSIRMFRKLKPKIDGVKRGENRGGLVRYPQPTSEQMRRIVSWWHGPEKPGQIAQKVSDMLGADVEAHWVRDKVKKATGAAARDAASDAKRPEDQWDFGGQD